MSTTKMLLLPGWFLVSLSLAACGGADSSEAQGYLSPEGAESPEDEAQLWPAPSDLESMQQESEADDEVNQCSGVRQCVYTPQSCCSRAAWITGASACPYRCCFPPGYATTTASNCCTQKAAYVGSQLTCIW
jgi:hypothetical protein